MVIIDFLQTLHIPILDVINLAFSFMGEELFLIAVLCLIFWCINKEFAYKIGFTYFISALAIHLLKITFRIPGQWIINSDSFPSGHTQSGTALFSMIAFKSKHILIKILCFLIIFLIGFSRIYLGVHTPLDVVISFILTLIIALLINFIMNTYTLDQAHRKIMVLIISLIPIFVLIYCMYLYYNDIVDIEYVQGCIKSSGAALGFLIGWLIEKKYINFSVRTYGVSRQLVKYFLGLAVVLIIKIGLKTVFSYFLIDDLPGDFIRYFIMIFWIICLYPLLINKLFKTSYQIF